MRRGVVLSFPPPRGLTRDDRECLRCFAASYPGTVIELLSAGHHRGVATIGAFGRQFWVERDRAVIRVRDAHDGRLLAESGTVHAALAQARTALLPGGMAVWSGRTGSLG